VQCRFSVPVLWDKKSHTIVNNESSEIIRIFNTAFNNIIPKDKAAVDIYPQALRAEIDSINEWVYDTVNSTVFVANQCRCTLTGAVDGVYKAGFSASQQAYEKAVVPLFDSLDRLEKMLTGKDYLVGGVLTEADIRLWVTIVGFVINHPVILLISNYHPWQIRFDPVYVGHFKCNFRTIRSGYPAIHSSVISVHLFSASILNSVASRRWMKKLYWNNPTFKDSTNFEHIKTHYYWSHPSVNPTRVVPLGPIPHVENL